jgi:hypothetical protein
MHTLGSILRTSAGLMRGLVLAGATGTFLAAAAAGAPFPATALPTALAAVLAAAACGQQMHR